MQTNGFKDAIAQAKSLTNALPGGELCLDEQDEVINMLERLKQSKKCVCPSSSSSQSLIMVKYNSRSFHNTFPQPRPQKALQQIRRISRWRSTPPLLRQEHEYNICGINQRFF